MYDSNYSMMLLSTNPEKDEMRKIGRIGQEESQTL